MYKVSSFTRKKSGLLTKEKEYEQLTKTITSSIQRITKNVTSMKKMVHKIGIAKDTNKLITQISTLEASTNELITKTFEDMQDLTALVNKNQSFKRQAKVDELKYDFMAAMNYFEMLQENLSHRRKQHIRIVPSKGIKSQHQLSQRDPEQEEQRQREQEEQRQREQEQERKRRREQEEQWKREHEELKKLREKEEEKKEREQEEHKKQTKEQESLAIQKEVNEALADRSANLKLLTSKMTEMAAIYKEFNAITAEHGEAITKTMEGATGSVQNESRDAPNQHKFLKTKYILIIIGAVVLVIIISVIIWLYA